MDFFNEQDQARRSTKLLVVLFLISVALLILLTNVFAAFTFWIFDQQSSGNVQAYRQAGHFFQYFSWQRFGKISLMVCGVIIAAMAFKWLQLSGGGKRVAEQLGGQRILSNTDNPQQKLVLNVVEEMAIASGMPVPAVYLLSNESAINAFAAGSTPADAIIGVTQGCIENFNREQLQGVIAHEFSHILNGDMRLNIRLIAILHGILFVGLIGHVLMRSGSSRRHSSFGRSYSSTRRSGDSRIALFGLALILIGWLGQFFGNLIKSAVSRQREFLADASAVQFTRNPEGISDALKIIGGHHNHSSIDASRAEEMSHLFFGQALSKMNSLFATHPPLEDRISRLEPSWNGQFIHQKISTNTPPNDSDSSHADLSKGMAFASTAAAFAENITPPIIDKTSLNEDADFDNIRSSINALPSSIIEQTRDPFGSTALLYCLLLSEDEASKNKQIDYIKLTKTQGLSVAVLQLYPEVKQLDNTLRLPLIELAMPSLKSMSPGQYKVFCRTLLLLIRADNKFELYEWCIYQIVRHYLDTEFNKPQSSRPQFNAIEKVQAEYQLILSLLSYHSDSEHPTDAFKAGAEVAGYSSIEILDHSDCKINDFVDATNRLALCYPLIKPRLLKGLAACALKNGSINSNEKEIITAIAAVMDSPIPRSMISAS